MCSCVRKHSRERWKENNEAEKTCSVIKEFVYIILTEIHASLTEGTVQNFISYACAKQSLFVPLYRLLEVLKKFFGPNMRFAPEVMLLISLRWHTISEANTGGTAAEVEPPPTVFH